MNPEGLTTVPSAFGPNETAERLSTAIVRHGMTVVAHIDHASAAAEVGLKLRPTKLFIFGNAMAGTPLMREVQTVGIDLPLRALVWEDADGKTWLSYNDPRWLAERHRFDNKIENILRNMTATLSAVASDAIGSIGERVHDTE
jgi:uncharacterized protein (DUF302 family)